MIDKTKVEAELLARVLKAVADTDEAFFGIPDEAELPVFVLNSLIEARARLTRVEDWLKSRKPVMRGGS